MRYSQEVRYILEKGRGISDKLQVGKGLVCQENADLSPAVVNLGDAECIQMREGFGIWSKELLYGLKGRMAR